MIQESFIEKYLNIINKSDLILLDANISENLIEYLFNNINNNIPICVEAVSCAKVIKFKKFLNKIFLFKSNVIEVKTLTQLENSSLDENVKYLIEKGVKKVVISNGDKPIIIGENNNINKVNIVSLNNIINETGAGDALLSGIIDHLLKKYSLNDSCLFGDKLAKLTLQCEKAVSEEVSNVKE